MNSKLFLLIAFLGLQLHMSFGQDQDECYNCGYMQATDGRRSKIPSQDEDIPFCGNDTIGEGTPTQVVGMGGCCFAFKIEHIDEETGDVTYESRHGASTDPDQAWFGQECGKTESGMHCDYKHISGGGYDQDGIVCHCYENKCNTEVPDLSSLPPPSPTQSNSSNRIHILQNVFIYVMLLNFICHFFSI